MLAKHRRPKTVAAVAALIGLVGLLAAAPAWADLKTLNDPQLAQVQGRSPLTARQLYGNLVAPIALLAQQSGAQPGASGAPSAQLQNLQFDATDWLSVFGLHYDGPSMGSFTLRNVDTSGLNITLQPHHP